MLKMDGFEKLIRGDGMPATKGGFHSPKHARREAYVLGLIARYIYAFFLGKVQMQRNANG